MNFDLVVMLAVLRCLWLLEDVSLPLFFKIREPPGSSEEYVFHLGKNILKSHSLHLDQLCAAVLPMSTV